MFKSEIIVVNAKAMGKMPVLKAILNTLNNPNCPCCLCVNTVNNARTYLEIE